MSRRCLAFFVGVAWLAAAHAAADPAPEPMPTPHVRVTTGDAELRLSGGRTLVVPNLSHVLAPPAWDKLDGDTRAMQDKITRLTAENDSFRKSAATWQPGWRTLLVAVGTGIALGAYGTYRITR